MPKGRVTVTIAMEYEIKPEHYEAGMTLEQMAQLDADQYRQDPFLLIEGMQVGSDDVKVTAVGEVIDHG